MKTFKIYITELSTGLKQRYKEKALKDMEARQEIDRIYARDPHEYLSPAAKINRKKFENRYNAVYPTKKKVEEEKQDPMLTFRKKVDARRLVPTRSGAKGGGSSSGHGDGGSGGGAGGGGSGGGAGGGGGGGGK